MNTTTIKTSQKSFNFRSSDLKREIRLMRSFIISMVGEDKEGKYNSKTIHEILGSTKEKPSHRFDGSKSFLNELHRI